MRPLALAVAVAAVIAASASATAGRGYTGLGAPPFAFKATHPHTDAALRAIGVAYSITRVRNGRVVAYHVDTNISYSNRARLALVAGVNLPVDARETNIRRSTCVVWHSARLQQLVGMPYAAGTTITGVPYADMQAERTAHC
jgi:hypothetical protein